MAGRRCIGAGSVDSKPSAVMALLTDCLPDSEGHEGLPIPDTLQDSYRQLPISKMEVVETCNRNSARTPVKGYEAGCAG